MPQPIPAGKMHQVCISNPVSKAMFSLQTFHQVTPCQYLNNRALSIVAVVLQAHADYEHRLQEEVNARLLKEQELMQLVWYLPYQTLPLPCLTLLRGVCCEPCNAHSSCHGQLLCGVPISEVAESILSP